MILGEQADIALTQRALGLPYIWNAPEAPATLEESRAGIHHGILERIDQERTQERDTAWHQERISSLLSGTGEPDKTTWAADWNTSWEFTATRQQELHRRHALAVRSAGRGLMTLNNRERLDTYGQPLTEEIATACQPIPLQYVLSARSENPRDVALHLQKAGYFDKPRVRGRVPASLLGIDVPRDTLDYLEVYPPATAPQSGEMSRHMMQDVFDASDNMLIGIIDDAGLHPVARQFEGRGAREIECYTATDVALIEEAIRNMPRIDTSKETPLRTFIDEFGSRDLLETAIALVGINTPYRRLLGQGRGLCVLENDEPLLYAAYEYLTTLQPGEMGYEEIAAEMGVGISTARRWSWQEDINTARPVYPAESAGKLFSRRVFPPNTAQRIMKRIAIGYDLEASIQTALQEELLEHGPLTIAAVGRTMGVLPAHVTRTFLDTQPAGQRAPVSNAEQLARYEVTGARAAAMAQRLFAERRKTISTLGLNVAQISLLANMDPYQVAQYLITKGHISPDAKPDEVSFNNSKLDTVLALFGVNLTDESLAAR